MQKEKYSQIWTQELPTFFLDSIVLLAIRPAITDFLSEMPKAPYFLPAQESIGEFTVFAIITFGNGSDHSSEDRVRKH